MYIQLKVWDNQSEILVDGDDLRAYWIVASLPMEVHKYKKDFELREDVFWLKNFGNRKNNAIFHMNARNLFPMEKINKILHVRAVFNLSRSIDLSIGRSNEGSVLKFPKEQHREGS